MKRLSPVHARLGMAIASLVGLFAAAYLFYTYVTGAPIACGLVSGCEAVRASKWAYSFGIPRPFFGLLFYAGVFGLLVARVATEWKARRMYHLTMIAGAFGFIESGFLFVIQWLDVKAFCLWCLMSAIAATALFLFSFYDRVEKEREIGRSHELRWYFYALLVFLPVSFFGIVFLTRVTPYPVETLPTLKQGSTLTPADILVHEDTPTEGPASSTVLVVEFGDFQCPACGAFHPIMKQIRETYRGRIRFAFREFPLTEIHAYAMDAAISATCANKQGKFFAYADLLYKNQEHLTNEELPLVKQDLLQYAKDVGMNQSQYTLCLLDPKTKEAVDRDQAEGFKLGVRFTPTLFVNKIKVDQALSEEELAKLIDRELAK